MFSDAQHNRPSLFAAPFLLCASQAATAYEAALRLVPDDAGIRAALEDARKKAGRQEVDQALRPAVLDFAKRKVCGRSIIMLQRADLHPGRDPSSQCVPVNLPLDLAISQPGLLNPTHQAMGAALVRDGRYREAAAKYNGALTAMDPLLEQLPDEARWSDSICLSPFFARAAAESLCSPLLFQ